MEETECGGGGVGGGEGGGLVMGGAHKACLCPLSISGVYGV